MTADFGKGGTWAGAIEQLERLHFVPVFVRSGIEAGQGNAALLQRGARPWPNPQDGTELGEALSAAAAAVAAEPKQETLAFALQEPPAVGLATPENKFVAPLVLVADAPAPAGAGSPADELFRAVRELLRRELAEARTETEVGTLLGVTKSQGKEWLTRLVAEGVLEKVTQSKPRRYRAVSSADRLL